MSCSVTRGHAASAAGCECGGQRASPGEGARVGVELAVTLSRPSRRPRVRVAKPRRVLFREGEPPFNSLSSRVSKSEVDRHVQQRARRRHPHWAAPARSSASSSWRSTAGRSAFQMFRPSITPSDNTFPPARPRRPRPGAARRSGLPRPARTISRCNPATGSSSASTGCRRVPRSRWRQGSSASVRALARNR